jgi:mRNA-degrading endonuclease toxin of MazEF toxin-antitoxin module
VVDHRDGLKLPSAVNCDELATITKDRLIRRVGRLSEERMEAVHDALRFALQLR